MRTFYFIILVLTSQVGFAQIKITKLNQPQIFEITSNNQTKSTLKSKIIPKKPHQKKLSKKANKV
jgi:hypothetical protein